MEQPTRRSAPSRAAAATAWRRVQHVVGPLAGHPAPAGLYVHGGVLGDAVATPTGLRRPPVVPAGGRADLGGCLNAFAAADWRAHAGTTTVRLVVHVDAPALLTVLRSDAVGAAQAVEQRLLAAGAPEAVDVSIEDCGAGGLVWFELQAGPSPVVLLDAGWAVQEPPRAGGVVVATPTIGLVDAIAGNLGRLAAAPALTALLSRVVVVDHAPAPIEQRLRHDLGGLVRVVRQPNLGGSGGFSRGMHEALGEPGAQSVLLLDDDVLLEPAPLLTLLEFARRATGSPLVGLQMFDARRPAVLDAGVERIVARTFWWTAAEPALAGADVAVRPVADQPALHPRRDADFSGWWGTLVPLDAVRAIGFAMPFFLKWDDAEYALRARAAGFGTVSLTGAAVWHESWRGKDDSRTWPAFFHARNRLVAALLHGGPGVRSGVLLASLLLEVKQLLALQSFAVERRHEGLEAVLAGPGALDGPGGEAFDRVRALAAAAPDQLRVPAGEAAAAPRARAAVPVPRAAPSGVGLAGWTVLQTLRHLAPVGRLREPGRLEVGAWWVVPSYDHVLEPSADGAAFFRLARDPRRFRRLLGRSAALHLRLWLRWPALRRAYRRAAPALTAPAAWRRRFE